MRIGILAALPGELKQLVNTGWHRAETTGKSISKWIGGSGEDVWIAVCAGMGADAARRAFAEAESDGPLDLVLSVGWAGALEPELRPGDAYVLSVVIDAQTGEQFQLTEGERQLRLVTTARVADGNGKLRLRTAYRGAVMVDMEAATIVRLAQMRGIPVCCIKAISDAVDDQIPDFNPFIDERGQMRMLPFVFHVIGRPKYWGPLIRLRRVSARGADALASAILTLLTGPKDIAKINRTGNVDW